MRIELDENLPVGLVSLLVGLEHEGRYRAHRGARWESLYKALSGERSPDFDTILGVMAALGLRLRTEAAHG